MLLFIIEVLIKKSLIILCIWVVLLWNKWFMIGILFNKGILFCEWICLFCLNFFSNRFCLVNNVVCEVILEFCILGSGFVLFCVLFCCLFWILRLSIIFCVLLLFNKWGVMCNKEFVVMDLSLVIFFFCSLV